MLISETKDPYVYVNHVHLEPQIPDKRLKKSNRTALRSLCFSTFVLILLALTHITVSIITTRNRQFINVSTNGIQKSQELVGETIDSSFRNALGEHLRDIYRNRILPKEKSLSQSDYSSAIPFSMLGKRMVPSGIVGAQNNSVSLITTPTSSTTAATPAPELPPTVILTTTVTPALGPLTIPNSPQSNQPTSDAKTTLLTGTVKSQPTTLTSEGPTPVPESSTSTDTSVPAGSPTSSESPVIPGSPTSTHNPTTKGPSTSGTKVNNGPSSSTRLVISQQTIYTTTLPDGAISTVTSITVIPADPQPTGASSATKTNGASSLQTNAARQWKSIRLREILVIVGIVIAAGVS